MIRAIYLIGIFVFSTCLLACKDKAYETSVKEIVLNLQSFSQYSIDWTKIGGYEDDDNCVLVSELLSLNDKIYGTLEFEYNDCSTSKLRYDTRFSNKPSIKAFGKISELNEPEWSLLSGVLEINSVDEKRIIEKRHFEVLRFLERVSLSDIENYINSLPKHCYSEVISNKSVQKQKAQAPSIRVWQIFNHEKKEYPVKSSEFSDQELSDWSDKVAKIDAYNYSCNDSGVYIYQSEFLFFIDRKGIVSIPSIKLRR